MARKAKPQELDGLEKYPCYASINADWAPYRLPDVEVSVMPNRYKEGQHLTGYRQPMGHRCMRAPCEGVLEWGNGALIDPKASGYWVWCPVCQGGYMVGGRYMWPLLRDALERYGAKPEELAQAEADAGIEEGEQEDQEGPEEPAEVSAEPAEPPPAPVEAVALPKKRGRPKGSVNKPKDPPPAPLPEGQLSIPYPDKPKDEPPPPGRRVSSLF